DALLVLLESTYFRVIQKLQLRDADTVLARDDPAKTPRDTHDPRDGCGRRMQHLVVVRIHRNIRVNVAVARMHVQRHEQSAAQHTLMLLRALIKNWREYSAAEDVPQRRPELAL